jgi:hypothetical protein
MGVASSLNRAIGYDHSVIRFFVTANVLTSSVRGTADHAVDVPAIRLQQILDDDAFRRCTLICDIEGTEVELVRREARTLSRCVESLIVEVHDRLVGGEETTALLQTLEQAGCRLIERALDSMALLNVGRSPAALSAGVGMHSA